MRPLFYLLLFLASCSSSSHEERHVLRINLPSDPITLDPRKGGDIASSSLQFLLFEGLTRFTERSTSDYGIAEKIEVSKDGLRYLFYLREAKWSNGDPVTAFDFERAWKTILDPAFPCPNVNLLYPIRHAQQVKSGALPIEEVGIKVLSPRLLEVHLDKPTPYFLELVAFSAFLPIHAKADAHLCNGPFQLTSWVPKDHISLEKNPTYWDARSVTLDGVEISLIENETAAFHLYEKGELDLMGAFYTSIPHDALMSSSCREEMHTQNTAALTFCAFNTTSFPFKSTHLRKAFAYAIDREEIGRSMKLGQAATSLVPSAMNEGKNRSLFADHQITLAKHHLDEALAELGCSREDLHGLTLTYRNHLFTRQVAQILQDQWKKHLGIDVRIETAEHKIFLDRLQKRDFQIAHVFLFAQYNDPLSILDRFKFAQSPKNYPGWEHHHYIALIDKAIGIQEKKERMAMLEEAEKFLLEEMPLAPLFHLHSHYIVQPYLDHVVFSPLGSVHIPSIQTKRCLYGH